MQYEEYKAEMAALRRDPFHRAQDAMEGLICDLNQWEQRAPLAAATDRDELDRTYPRHRCDAESAVTRICAIQRDLDQLRNRLLDELGEYDTAYFACDEALAHQPQTTAGGVA